MKKMAKKLVAMLMVAMLAVACVGTALAEDVYSVETENFETWDYSFCNINAFGDDPGVGMLNIQSWGNKKLALGDDGTCDGVGCTWKITLSVDGTEYTLKAIATIVGAGDVYAGTGEFTYTFNGAYEAADNAFILGEPTYVAVDLTGDFTRLSDGSDFADYIPSAPASVTCENEDGGAEASAWKNKIVPSLLTSTVFGGATIVVDGSEIVSVDDINFPVI